MLSPALQSSKETQNSIMIRLRILQLIFLGVLSLHEKSSLGQFWSVLTDTISRANKTESWSPPDMACYYSSFDPILWHGLVWTRSVPSGGGNNKWLEKRTRALLHHVSSINALILLAGRFQQVNHVTNQRKVGRSGVEWSELVGQPSIQEIEVGNSTPTSQS